MNFPVTVFAERNGVWRQFFHLVSEVWELFWALLWRDWKHAGRERVDVMQSADTLGWILQWRHQVNRDEATARVLVGNGQRGYYQAEPVGSMKDEL